MTDQEVIECLRIELSEDQRYHESLFATREPDSFKLHRARRVTALTRAIQILEEKIAWKD